MKRLLLARHAQALPQQDGRDFDRPLSPKGLEDAEALGKYMARKKYAPDLILCSGAKRTRNTLEQIINGFEGGSFETQYSDAIYDTSKAGLFKMLQELGARHDSVMVIGHNPTIYELCAWMAAQGADNFMNRLSEGYTPATLSIFEFPIEDWGDLNPNDGKLVEYAAPIDYNTPMRPTRWM